MEGELDRDHLERLIAAGRAIVAERDLDKVLQRVVETGREITGARYAALGVLDEAGSGLARFITSGLTDEQRAAIGDLPRGRGVLGVLIEDPRPLRLAQVGGHAGSYGFPAGHPPMETFLGVPVRVGGDVYGNLYLTEKQGGLEFDEGDEAAVVLLAGWAAIAIENARLHAAGEERRHELEVAVRGLEATRSIALAIGADTDLGRTLELIVKRARALVGARAVLMMLREGEDLCVSASAGEVMGPEAARIPIAGSTAGEVLKRGTAERFAAVRDEFRVPVEQLGVSNVRTALLAPLIYRGQRLGVLGAFDRGSDAAPFTADDEAAMRSFAASASIAVATARSVELDRLRNSVESAEAERARWARELHDETLQTLAALRFLLSGALRSGDPRRLQDAAESAIEHVERSIGELRAIISDLRPAALGELGLRAAVASLVQRHRERGASRIELHDELPGDDGLLIPEAVQVAAYRVIQEALTNASRHALASRVEVTLGVAGGRLRADVIDDGVGFDPEGVPGGFGIPGMVERVRLLSGTLEIGSAAGRGTRVSVEIPLPPGEAESAGAVEEAPA